MKLILLNCFFGVAIVLLAGCGSSVPRTRVRGTAEFDGKPIAQGVVYLNPDTGRKNSGPQGFATITDGHFDTGATGGKGATPGHTVVRVEGFDGKADAERPKGKMLFAYETHADLATGSASLDIKIKPSEVLKSAPPGKLQKTGP